MGEKVGGLYVDIKGDRSPLKRELSRAYTAATASARKIGGTINKNITSGATRAKNAIVSLKGAVVALGIAATAYVSIKLGAMFTEAAAGAEELKASLDTITKGKGVATFEALNKWAKDMPVNTDKAIESYKNLSAMGLKPTLKDMTVLVDTSSALGGGAETLQSVARALGQIHTKGKVSAEELMQLAEKGIPAYEILADKLNLTKKEVGDIGRAGVSSSAALKALMQGMEERFGGAAQNYMATWKGMIESSKALWVEFQRAVMQSGPFDAMKKGLKSFLDYLGTNQGQMNLGRWAQETAVAVMQGFQIMVKSANIFYAVMKNTQSMFAGLMSGVSKLKMSALDAKIEAKQNLVNSQDKDMREFLGESFLDKGQTQLKALQAQKKELQENVKYWDDIGVSAQVSLMKAKNGFAKITKVVDDLKSKTNSVSLFSGGTELPGNNAGIGGGGDSGSGKIDKATEAVKKYGFQYKNLTDMWALKDSGLKTVAKTIAEPTNEIVSNLEVIKNASQQVFKSMENYIVDFVTTGKFKFKDFARSVVADLVRIAVQQTITNRLTSWVGNLFTPSAKGNAFDSAGHMSAYAKGGAFTNSVVSKPTMFAHGSGFGLMGEKGDEAIMPLTRTSGGDLGVKALGGSGGNSAPPVQINLINKTGTEASAKQEQPRWDGEKWVLGIVMDALDRNKGGFKNNMKAAMQGA